LHNAPVDFALIPVVLNEYDTAEHTGEDKMSSKKLLFIKKIEGIIFFGVVQKYLTLLWG
jgi:hypothetical protein